MKFKTTILSLAVAAVATTALFASRAAQAPEMPTPKAQHKMLQMSVGEWEGTMTSFMPGMPTAGVPAKETIEAVGGFWTQARFECSFMGMPYVGAGCLGYDEAKKKYVGTWFDNMSSEMALMEGDYDETTKTLTMRWTAPDMMTGKPTPHRYECVMAADSTTSTFFMGEGAGQKTMIIDLKRKGAKKAAEAGAGR